MPEVPNTELQALLSFVKFALELTNGGGNDVYSDSAATVSGWYNFRQKVRAGGRWEACCLGASQASALRATCRVIKVNAETSASDAEDRADDYTKTENSISSIASRVPSPIRPT